MGKSRKMKKWLSGLVAFVMMFAMMATSVGAAPLESTGLDPDLETGAITLSVGEGKKDTSQFTAYKVLDAEYIEGQDTYEYSYTADFQGMEDSYSLEAISELVNGADDYHITANSADDLATALEAFLEGKTIAGTTLDNNAPTDLPIGYYLILETTSTPNYQVMKPMLVAVPQMETEKYNYNVQVSTKDQPQTTIKTIEEAEEAIKDSIASQVGKVETFNVQSSVPVYNENYKDITYYVTDTLGKGLDFIFADGQDKPTLKVEKITDGQNTTLSAATDYDYTYDADKRQIKVDFSGDKFESVRGADYVYLTYQAKVNKDALVTDGKGNLAVNNNEVETTYTTTPGGDKGYTDDITKNFIAGVELKKVDGADTTKNLQGAEFTVYSDEACENPADLITYTVDDQGVITENKAENLSATATTDKNGVVRFEGLGAGTYYIKETKAPDGYTLLKDPIKVEVEVQLPEKIETGDEEATYTFTVTGVGEDQVQDNQDGTATITVANSQGFTLPKTGGMGTYLFTIGGVAIMLAAAGVFFVSRRKSSAK